MLFHIFDSQEERRNFGSSAFIEVQFCKLPVGTKLKKIVSVGSINYRQNDSLYIDDADLFYTEYQHIFDCGIYNNLNKGVVDIFGINYYAPDLLDSIIERLNNEKPTDYSILEEWLMKSKEYNGIYILGI